MAERKILLEVRDLCKVFPLSKKRRLTAVDHVSFDIYEGEKFGVVGESGCGKSTLGRVILQLYDASSGKVIYHGKAAERLHRTREEGVDLCSLSRREMKTVRSDMQMIFQDPAASLDPRETVGDAIS